MPKVPLGLFISSL